MYRHTMTLLAAALLVPLGAPLGTSAPGDLILTATLPGNWDPIANSTIENTVYDPERADAWIESFVADPLEGGTGWPVPTVGFAFDVYDYAWNSSRSDSGAEEPGVEGVDQLTIANPEALPSSHVQLAIASHGGTDVAGAATYPEPSVSIQVYGTSYTVPIDGHPQDTYRSEGWIYSCRGEWLAHCPIKDHSARADRATYSPACSDTITSAGIQFGAPCDWRYNVYFYPEAVYIVLSEGKDVEVQLYEAANPNPPSGPRTTEGSVIVGDLLIVGPRGPRDCDYDFHDMQRGTGFRLEGRDGADFDIVFIHRVAYPFTTERQLTYFEGVGDEWGNVPSNAHEVCISLKKRDVDRAIDPLPLPAEFTYTDGLPRFASSDHSTRRVETVNLPE